MDTNELKIFMAAFATAIIIVFAVVGCTIQYNKGVTERYKTCFEKAKVIADCRWLYDGTAPSGGQ